MSALIIGGGVSETGLGKCCTEDLAPQGAGDVALAPWLKAPLGQRLECNERGVPLGDVTQFRLLSDQGLIFLIFPFLPTTVV